MTKGYFSRRNYNDEYWHIQSSSGYNFMGEIGLPPGKYICNASFHYHAEEGRIGHTVDDENREDTYGEAILVLGGSNHKTDFDLNHAPRETRGNVSLMLASEIRGYRPLSLYCKTHNFIGMRVTRVRMSAIALDELASFHGDGEERLPPEFDFHRPTLEETLLEFIQLTKT